MLWSQNIYVSILSKIYGANAVAVRRQNQSYDKMPMFTYRTVPVDLKALLKNQLRPYYVL